MVPGAKTGKGNKDVLMHRQVPFRSIGTGEAGGPKMEGWCWLTPRRLGWSLLDTEGEQILNILISPGLSLKGEPKTMNKWEDSVCSARHLFVPLRLGR